MRGKAILGIPPVTMNGQWEGVAEKQGACLLVCIVISRETARNFVHPTGAHDIYKAGEWAIQGGKFTECVSDTSYSMEEYAAAWEVRE